jgi:hypothetical protein
VHDSKTGSWAERVGNYYSSLVIRDDSACMLGLRGFKISIVVDTFSQAERQIRSYCSNFALDAIAWSA